MIKLLVISIFLFLANSLAFCQMGAKVSVGLGLPDLANIKISNDGPLQINLGFGYAPIINAISISSGLSYYFSNKIKKDNPNKWFVNTGFAYMPPAKSNSSTSQKFIIMYPRIGRVVYFKKKSNQGFEFTLGVLYQIWTNERYSYGPIGLGSPENKNSGLIFPSASISYFLKI